MEEEAIAEMRNLRILKTETKKRRELTHTHGDSGRKRIKQKLKNMTVAQRQKDGNMQKQEQWNTKGRA